MKRILLPAFMILLAVLLLAALPTEADAAVYEDTVRLHILANSDTAEDQALKIALRDRLLTEYGTRLQSAVSAADAEARIRSLLPEMETEANRFVREAGYDHPVRITLGEEWYDTRNYRSFTLPCGYYRSLRVLIGDAEGQNWWCVMYPPLCLDLALEDAPADDGILSYTDAERRLVGGGRYTVKFRLLEVISELLK